MYKQMVFLSGLPRTGSTLLNSILYQNPRIHTEGQSALPQLMWDMHTSCNYSLTSASHLLRANHREDTGDELLRSIPKIYYRNVDRPIVVDKSILWCVPGNYWMITEWINPDPRVIVLVRPVEEIYRSIRNLNPDDPRLQEEILFKEQTPPLMWPLEGVRYARENNNGNFLFINYHDLVDDTTNVLHKIYDFCGWKKFKHTLDNISSSNTEDDLVHGFPGMHDIRSEISRREVRYELTPRELDMCLYLNEEYRVLG